MLVEQMDLRSFALFVLFCAFLGATLWYLRVPRRRARLWRLMHRSWGPRPKQRFQPLRRADVLRSAVQAAMVGVALLALFGASAGAYEMFSPRNPPMWVDALAFMSAIGAALAFLVALATLIGALRFRERAFKLPFTVLSNDVRVGTADFFAFDRERSVFAGPFLPEPAFAAIHPVVRLLAEAYPDIGGPDARRAKLDEYLEKKDALKLELLDPEGVLVPTTEISILDFTLPGGDDVFRIDVEASLEQWEARGLVGAME